MQQLAEHRKAPGARDVGCLIRAGLEVTDAPGDCFCLFFPTAEGRPKARNDDYVNPTQCCTVLHYAMQHIWLYGGRT